MIGFWRWYVENLLLSFSFKTLKLQKYILSLSSILLVSFVIPDKKLLVGTWVSTNKSELQTIILENDNTFLQIVPYGDDNKIELNGSYKLIKDSIHFIYPEAVDAGRYKIERLNRKSLRLSKTTDGETMNFDFKRSK